MSSIRVLQEVFDRGGLLRDVWEARFEGSPDFVTALKFQFEEFALVVSAVPEYDTCDLYIGDLHDEAGVVVRATDEVPWSGVVGLGMRWGWELTNHQGYSDGVRFEFADPDRGVSIEFDIVVMASSLHVHRCEAVNRLPNQRLQPTARR